MISPYLCNARPCIGVFDSGFGGLTVLRALMLHLPGADYLYLGDTARLPYGSKSAETITRCTSAAIQTLVERGAQLVVVACNTASALALPQLREKTPVLTVGVIQPGAWAAAHAATDVERPVLVLATEATVASHAYASACIEQNLKTVEKACPLLVPLVEEGWIDHPVTAQVVDIYLRDATANMAPSAVLLGCTHYPLLRTLIESTVQGLLGAIPVVDSAEATARYVWELLPQARSLDAGLSQLQCFVTDSPDKFQRLGARFLEREIEQVTLIHLEA